MKTIKTFIQDTRGDQLLQWAIILFMTVSLAVLVFSISDIAKTKVEAAGEMLNEIDVDYGDTSIPGGTNLE